MLWLKKISLPFYTHHLAKKRKGCDATFSLDMPVETVGIFYGYDTQEAHDCIMQWEKRLKNAGKQVELCCYGTTQPTSTDPSLPMYTPRDVMPWGKIRHSKLYHFIHRHFDYLYCLNFQNDVVANYLLAKSKARCKVGCFSKHHAPLLDIMINFTTTQEQISIDQLMQQMVHYTKLLDTHAS